MILTKTLFDQFGSGEIMRIVITKMQNVYDPMLAELKFVAVKGDSGRDWVIYCQHSHRSTESILAHGDKITISDNIRNLCPCDDEVFKLYRY